LTQQITEHLKINYFRYAIQEIAFGQQFGQIFLLIK